MEPKLLKRTGFKRPESPYKLSRANGLSRVSKSSQRATDAPKQPSLRRKGRIKVKVDRKLVEWSRNVRERDGNQCQWPGLGYDIVLGMPINTIIRIMLVISPCITGDKRIDPHHIAPRGRRRDLKYVVANGICLCRTHHDWVGEHPIEAEKIGLNNFETYEKAAKESR